MGPRKRVRLMREREREREEKSNHIRRRKREMEDKDKACICGWLWCEWTCAARPARSEDCGCRSGTAPPVSVIMSAGVRERYIYIKK